MSQKELTATYYDKKPFIIRDNETKERYIDRVLTIYNKPLQQSLIRLYATAYPLYVESGQAEEVVLSREIKNPFIITKNECLPLLKRTAKTNEQMIGLLHMPRVIQAFIPLNLRFAYEAEITQNHFHIKLNTVTSCLDRIARRIADSFSPIDLLPDIKEITSVFEDVEIPRAVADNIEKLTHQQYKDY